MLGLGQVVGLFGCLVILGVCSWGGASIEAGCTTHVAGEKWEGAETPAIQDLLGGPVLDVVRGKSH